MIPKERIPSKRFLRNPLFLFFFFFLELQIKAAALAVGANRNYSPTVLYLLLSSILLCSASSSSECTNPDFQTLFSSVSLVVSPSAPPVTSSLFVPEVKERGTRSVSMTVNDALVCRYSSRSQQAQQNYSGLFRIIPALYSASLSRW